MPTPPDDHRWIPRTQGTSASRGRAFPLFHVGFLLLGLSIMGAFAVHVGRESGSGPEKVAKPRPPRSPAYTARQSPGPPHTVTLFIVDSQEQADALEIEATLGAASVATTGPLGVDAKRQYVIGDGPNAAAQIESTRGLIAYLNLDTEATGPTIVLQIVDVRGEP